MGSYLPAPCKLIWMAASGIGAASLFMSCGELAGHSLTCPEITCFPRQFEL